MTPEWRWDRVDGEKMTGTACRGQGTYDRLKWDMLIDQDGGPILWGGWRNRSVFKKGLTVRASAGERSISEDERISRPSLSSAKIWERS
jgi:hypothetical protein